MDTGGDSTHQGNGHPVPSNRSDQSADAVPSKEGAPVEPLAKADASAGSPSNVEPLVVVDNDPPKRVKLSPNQFAFLAALAAEAGNISAAARRCEQSRRNHQRWMVETDAVGDPTPESIEYRRIVAEIESEACDEVEGEIRRRGIEGVLEPKFYEGNVCGHVRVFSDVLLIFRAKALMPEKYRERHEVVGAGGTPLNPAKVEHVIKYDFSNLNDDEINELYSKLRRSRILPSTGN